jgi:hypothetical protein
MKIGFLTLLVALTLSIAAALAQQPDEFQVNTFTTGFQDLPAAVAMPEVGLPGRFVAVWRSRESGQNPSDVHACIFDNWGDDRAWSFRVNSYTTGEQWLPSVASAYDGLDFVVAWTSHEQDGSDYGVFARRFSRFGGPLADEFRVNTYTTSRQFEPDVAADRYGNFVVVWSGAGVGDASGIFARRFDQHGVPAGDEFCVNTFTTGTQYQPSVAVARGGEFVVAWESVGQPPDSSGSGVFARRFDAAGQALGPEFLVNSTTTSRQANPDVAMDAAGRFLIVWEGLNPVAPGGGCAWNGPDCAVFGRAYDRAGTARGPEFHLGGLDHGLGPAVALGAGSQLVAAWDDVEYNPEDGRGVYYRQFEDFGAASGREGFVNDYSIGDQRAVAVAMLPGGKYLALWSSDGQDGSATGVFGRWAATDLIFADGFEDHDLQSGSPWSSIYLGDDLFVSSLAGLNGTATGLAAVVDDTEPLLVEDNSPEDEPSYYARFHFDTNGFDPGEALNHRRLRLFIAGEDDTRHRVVTVVLRRVAGAYAVMARTLEQPGRRVDTAWYPISDGPHRVQLYWQRSRVPGAALGRLQMWIDGSFAGDLALDNFWENRIDFARLGAMSAKRGASGTLYLDEFESRRIDF